MNLSGPPAFHVGLQVAAHNLANAVTPGFEPSRVIYQPDAGGGVRAHVEHPRAQRPVTGDDQDDRPASGTDVPGELVEMSTTKNTYRANLRAFRAQSESIGILIDTLA